MAHMKVPVPFQVYSPPEVDRIWFWVYCNDKISIYPIFCLLKEDYKP